MTNCNDCTAYNTCNTCVTNYYPSGNICSTCSGWISNCSTCTAYNNCTVCSDNFWLSSSTTCTVCIYPCVTCTNATTCTGSCGFGPITRNPSPSCHC